MFGYIKPYKNEMKLKHIKEYKSYYCTLCNGIRSHFGIFNTIFLNYEMVFLLLLLEGICEQEKKEMMVIKCIFNPLKKEEISIDCNLLKYVSFINIQLVIAKLTDDYEDNKNFISLLVKLMVNSNHNYKKMLVEYESIVKAIDGCIDELSMLEKSGMATFDECADTMGRLLEAIILFYIEHFCLKKNKEAILKIGNIIGKWVYLVDAYDDYEKDVSDNKFNPLKEFAKQNTGGEEVNDKALLMFAFMVSDMNKLLNSLEIYQHKEIIENIVKFGLNNTVLKIKKQKERKDKTCMNN